MREILIATLAVYKDCITSTNEALIKNWKIIVGSFCLYFALQIVGEIVAPLGIAGGFIYSLAFCACLSLYYSWIYQAVKKSRLDWKDLTEFDIDLFLVVISASFMLFLIDFMTRPVLQDANGLQIKLIVSFAVVFMFNVLPEVIYFKGAQSVYAFSEALKFTKENWIEWYIPFIVMLSPWLLMGSSIYAVLLSFALVSPLLPTVILISGLQFILPVNEILAALIGLVLANWFMIFRGKLFQELESGSRRRRIYLAKQR
jgi:hypothetical protein